jgi:hypothetical protein
MCCGKKRAQARKNTNTKQVTKPEEKAAPNSPQNGSSSPYFQYLGNTALTVMGPWTHKHYRFDHPRAVVAVDPRDIRAMAAVSILKQVEKQQKHTSM